VRSPAERAGRVSAGGRPPVARAGGERLLLAAIALGGLLAPLNSTMIAVALPDIRRDFELSHGALGWLVSAYLIAMAVAQPIGGRLGDELGRARVIRVSLLVFLVLSLAASIAPWFPLLVAFRIGQAAAGAALIPNGMAMLREAVPVSRLGRMNGFFNAAMSVSAASGPLVGAAVLEFSSWRALFLLNIPVVALALLLHARLRDREAPASDGAKIDWVGGALLAATLAGVTWLLGALGGEADPLAVAGGVAGVTIVLALFVRWQMTGHVAVAPWALFRSRSFAGATAYIMVSNLVMYTSLLTIPFFISEVQGKGPASTGVLLGVMSFLMAAGSPLSGYLSDAVGRRPPALAGAVIALAGAVLLAAGITADVSFAYLAAALAMLGLGIGLGSGAAMTAAIESAPRALAGSASGTNSMMRYIGSIVGAGMLAGLLGGEAIPGAGVFRLIFGVVTAMAIVAVVAASQIHRYAAEDDRARAAQPLGGPMPFDKTDP
jgi:MFS family permease